MERYSTIAYFCNVKNQQTTNMYKTDNIQKPKVFRMAFASKTGQAVDRHFGMTDKFLIFELNTADNSVSYIENRSTTAVCAQDCCHSNHNDEEASFEKVICQLNDVSAIFVSKIGEHAANFIENKGKAVYESPFPIEPLINKIIEDKLYLTDQWQ